MSDIVGGSRRPGAPTRDLPPNVEVMLRQLRQEKAEMQRVLEEMQNAQADSEARLARALSQMRQPEAVVRPRTIAEIPGPRHWREYLVRIPFTNGETGMQQATVEISTDGPFILTDVAVQYQVDDAGVAPTSLQKRVIPCTGYWPAVYQAGAVASGTMDVAALQYYPELFFQIRIDGSGRYWTNLPTPAAAFQSWGGPKFAGIESWVESKNRIIVEATPQLAMPLAGTCLCTFSGYQIIGNISIGEILGYAP